MKKIGLLSDTHSYLNPKINNYFKEVDEIWHAGDIGNLEVADALEAFKPLRAVYGNIDGGDLRIRYPEHLFFTLENVSVLMMHIGHYPPYYNANALPLIRQYKPHLFICGHSHILKVMPDAKHNLLHINPGACGHYGVHKVSTLIRFKIDDDRIKDLEVIEMAKNQ